MPRKKRARRVRTTHLRELPDVTFFVIDGCDLVCEHLWAELGDPPGSPRASTRVNPLTGRVIPDKSEGPSPLRGNGPSAPFDRLRVSGVDNQYSR